MGALRVNATDVLPTIFFSALRPAAGVPIEIPEAWVPPREPIQGLWRSFKIWRIQERRDGAGRPRRFPAPWRVIEHSESFVVEDANGRPLAYVYFEDEPVRHGLMNRLTSNEARRVVSNIAKLPDLLKKLASRVTAWGT